MKSPTLKAALALSWALTGVLLGQSLSQPALAALGADASSVESDRMHLKGQIRATSAANYTVQEIQTPTSTVVREYVSSTGKVFAVSWRGPLLPDLSQTLGTYFGQYRAAAAASHAGHHHLSVQQPDLVVQSGGHMRAYFGYAYVPSLLPQDFSTSDIQ